ncbi:MAG TPA: AraC family transcriptional regulator [Pseudosphingobacterium sp.]|nr:AraC family transcriptional regulator [Pseudosphingobacterium sp.]
MDPYRKYFSSEQLQELVEMQPNWGVNVLNVGHNIHSAHTSYPDKNHPNHYVFNWKKGRMLKEYQLVFIAAGHGSFKTEHLGEVPINPGSVFLLFPDTWHTFRPLEKSGWEEYWVGFNGPYAEYLMGQDCFNPNFPLIHMGFNLEFLDIFIRLLETLKGEGIAYCQIASCLTIQLLGLTYAAALLKKSPQNRKEHIINNIRFKMHDSLHTNINLDELAAQHNVSYTWFRKAFKELIGISPGQYLLNLKLEKSCKMLKESELTISEIAFATGFASEYHFSKIFKKKLKMAPSLYKRCTY